MWVYSTVWPYGFKCSWEKKEVPLGPLGPSSTQMLHSTGIWNLKLAKACYPAWSSGTHE